MTSKEYFDKVAERWDSIRAEFFSEKVREKIVELAGAKPGMLAADVGAGTGFMTEELVKRGLRVIAIDQSEMMLQQLRRKLGDTAAVDCRLGESESLPVQSNAVDYVFANMYLHHVESPLNAIKEMVRILKPGGKLFITDLDEHCFDFLKTEHHDRWMGFKREDIKNWLLTAGLKNVTVDCLGEDCCTKLCSGEKQARVSIFSASGEK
jgi:ubiquinone/menaquinone biosynthesis C-methylase UbiE